MVLSEGLTKGINYIVEVTEDCNIQTVPTKLYFLCFIPLQWAAAGSQLYWL